MVYMCVLIKHICWPGYLEKQFLSWAPFAAQMTLKHFFFLKLKGKGLFFLPIITYNIHTNIHRKENLSQLAHEPLKSL